jgi:hypothetical protein
MLVVLGIAISLRGGAASSRIGVSPNRVARSMFAR